MSIKQKQMPARVFLSAKKNLTIPEIPMFADEVVGKMIEETEKLGLVINGPSEFIYFGCTGDLQKTFELRIAIPIEQKKNDSTIFEYFDSPAFDCVSQDYQGSMKEIGDGWNSFCFEAEKEGFQFKDGGSVREVYKNWIRFDDLKNITELQIEI